MATPTWAEAATQLANGIKPFTDLVADFPTIVSSIDSAEQDLEGDYMPAAVVGTLADLRAALSRAVSPSEHRRIWDAWSVEVLRVAGLAFIADPEARYARIHRYMHDNSYSFNDRDLTVAATGTAGGSNVGTGTLDVLAVDWEAYNLQHAHSETKTWECIRDQNLGALKNAEVFQVYGEDASKDRVEETGSGMRTLTDARGLPLVARHCGAGAGGTPLQNAGFDQAFSGTGTDKIPGWTIGSTAGDVTSTTSTVYRTEPGVTTSRALQIASGSDEITQALSVQRINAIGERVPWQFSVAVKKTGSGDTGTLTLKMGSQSQAINLANSPHNTTSWVVASMDLDKDLFYRNWREDAPDIEIEWASTSDVLYLDCVRFAPLYSVGGLWWWLEGGATAFLERDVFTHATSGGAWADAELMNSARYAQLPVSLPSATSAGETIADP